MYCLQPGLNLRTLGPVAGTLTITPLGMTSLILVTCQEAHSFFFMPITYDFILGIVADVYNALVTFPAVFIINIHLFST
jgi:hypothetical protein